MTMQQTIGDQTRYVELRYEGERVIQGTLMRYGDTAEFPWGDKERFEPGCFGPINEVDFILDKQHDRTREIARTGGGGITLTDSPQSLELRADLLDCTDANDTLTLVRGKVLRGLSVTFRPIEHRLEISKDGKYTIIHKRAELRGGGVVDRPQYKQSTLREQVRSLVNMNDEEIRALVAELLEKQRATKTPSQIRCPPANVAELVAAGNEAPDRKVWTFGTTIATAVTTAVLNLPHCKSATEAAEAAAAAAEEERMGMMNGKKKKDGKMMEDDDDEKDMAEQIAALDVEIRAELIVSVKPSAARLTLRRAARPITKSWLPPLARKLNALPNGPKNTCWPRSKGSWSAAPPLATSPVRNAKDANRTNPPHNGGVAIEEARILGNPTADINREFTRMRTNGNK